MKNSLPLSVGFGKTTGFLLHLGMIGYSDDSEDEDDDESEEGSC